jgi:hypothetical protein
MVQKFQGKLLLVILVSFLLIGCVSFRNVNRYANASLIGLQKFDVLGTSFKQCCIENCLSDAIQTFDLENNICPCSSSEKADQAMGLTYHALKNYLTGLAKLSANSLKNIDLIPFSNSINDSMLISLSSDQMTAYGAITQTFSNAITQKYRKQKLRVYLQNGHEPFTQLVGFLDFSLSQNLRGTLEVEKLARKVDAFNLLKDSTLSNWDRREVGSDYYAKVRDLESSEKLILAYSKILNHLVTGHKQLVESFRSTDLNRLKEILPDQMRTLKDLIVQFTKLQTL